MKRRSVFAALLCAVTVSACGKSALQDITAPITGGAFIRFHNYSVGAPGVNFYANTQKLTAVSVGTCSPTPRDSILARQCATTGIESPTGVVYPGTANGGNYERVTPGQYTLSGKIAAPTDNGLSISSTMATLAEGKFYTYYASGIYNIATKSSDAFLVEDNLPTTFDYTKSYVRFVNASANAPSISASSSLQGSTQNVTIATGLAYKSASQFVTLAPGLSDVTITIGGVSAVFKDFNMLGGHVLTLAVRGDATSTSATTGLAISGVYNR